jgi:WD40 repeat protein
MFSGSVEEHPLLVYLTALPFTPVNTLLYSTFMTDDIPRIVGGFNQSWSPLLHMFRAHENNVRSLAFFPDGTRIATSSDDSLIRVWDVVSGSEVIAPLADRTGGIWCLVVSLDGLHIASGSDDRTVRLWDATTGAEVSPLLRGHSAMVTSVAFSPDGTRIASGSYDHTIRVWDAASGSAAFVLCGHKSYVLSVVFTPDGRQIISSSKDNTISVWDALSGSVIHIHPVEGLRSSRPERIAVSTDGKMIACGSNEGTIRIWQLNASSRSLDIQTGHTRILSLAFFPDGRHIIATSSYRISVWDVISGTMIWVSDQQKWMNRIALSPNGEQFVIGYDDGMVGLWDATSLSRDFPDHGPHNPTTTMSFSPDGRQIASSYSDDASIHILDTQSGIEMTTPLQGHDKGVISVAFSPCGNRIASGSYDSTIRVWDLFSDAESLVLRGHERYVNCIAFSRDGQQIASGSMDVTVRLWNTTSGAQIIPALRGHKECVNAVAFSPDGTKLASCDNECACLWDIISSTKIFHQRVITDWHLSPSLAFSPDEQDIRIHTRDSMLVWDTNNGCLNPTPCYLHEVCSISEPMIVTTDGLIVGAQRILGKLPSIVSISRYTASTRSIAFTCVGRPLIFIMHFPPSVLTSPMTRDENMYESKPILWTSWSSWSGRLESCGKNWCVSREGDAALRDAEADNAMLVDERENMKGLLEENTYEMERLREIVEERGGENGFGGIGS